jgi:rfaE bifunctional protein nucleotidyltransferase chain/domain
VSEVIKKIINIQELEAKIREYRFNGQTIAHCHGVFDLLHVGHIRHLKEAASVADKLVVTITGDSYVNKGPSRPEFNEKLRAEVLSSLDCVDLVYINNSLTAVDIISKIKPEFYVKGPDYRNYSDDVSGAMLEEKNTVESSGGQVHITDDISFSSTKLLNTYFDKLPTNSRDKLNAIKNDHSMSEIINLLNNAGKLSVLVIGETIIDEYQYCSAIGKSSKSPTLAVNLETSESFVGGALAIANHLEDFAGKVTVTSVAGNDDYSESFIKSKLNSNINLHLLKSDNHRTIVKRRIVERYFFHKLLEIYEMDLQQSNITNEKLIDIVKRLAPLVDVVIVADFGHDMISDKLVEIIEKYSKYLSLNVQMNAGNMGYNTLSKYSRADYVSITEGELRLDSQERYENLEKLISDTSDRLGTSMFSITQGGDGCVVKSKKHALAEIPAIIANDEVVDRVGAGDVFFAVTSLLASLNAPPDVLGLIGNVVAADSVRSIGTGAPIKRVDTIRSLATLLK